MGSEEVITGKRLGIRCMRFMTCRAGRTLSSSKAYKLLPSTSHQPQQNAAVAGQSSNGDHAEPAVVARITVATAAHVPQVW